MIFHFIVFYHISCGVTILRSDGSQYDAGKTITLTEKKVEELCPTPSTTTPAPTTTTTVAVLDKIITKVEIVSKIIYRYAQTVVKSIMTNTFNTSQEVTFNMTLSEEAFISNFTVTSGGEESVAQVMDCQEAIQKYKDARDLGKTAGGVNTLKLFLLIP